MSALDRPLLSDVNKALRVGRVLASSVLLMDIEHDLFSVRSLDARVDVDTLVLTVHMDESESSANGEKIRPDFMDVGDLMSALDITLELDIPKLRIVTKFFGEDAREVKSLDICPMGGALVLAVTLE